MALCKPQTYNASVEKKKLRQLFTTGSVTSTAAIVFNKGDTS